MLTRDPSVARSVRLASLALAGAGACALGACSSGSGARSAVEQAPVGPVRNAGVSGSWIVTLDRGEADADASTLTMLQLPIPDVSQGDESRIVFKQGIVPCDVRQTGWDMQMSPDGRWAIIPGGGADQGSLQLVALGAEQPTIIDTVRIGEPVSDVSWRGDGMLAAVTLPGSGQIALVQASAAGFAQPTLWPITGGVPVSVEWSPSGRTLAVLTDGSTPLQFFGVRPEQGGSPGMRRLPADLSAMPGSGLDARSVHWTPDERSLLVFGSILDEYRAGATPAGVSLVAFDEVDGARWLGGFNIAGSPVAAALSPTGDLLAVVTVDFEANLRGSISLFSLDEETGALEVAHQMTTQGAPSAVAFDAAGAHLLSTDFENDLVRVWRVDRAEREPRLVDTGLEVGTGVAPHAVAVVP